MVIKYKKLVPDAQTPTYGSGQAAGADLYALEGTAIPSGATVFLKTGIAAEIPDGYMGLVFARSGLASKRGLAPANKVGVIDSDYRGEITVAIYNHSKTDAFVEKGERIAQLVITPYIRAEYCECSELSETERACGGFGSTGKK